MNMPTEPGWYWFEGEVHPEFYDTWEYAGFVELYANEEEPPELIVVFASYMDAEPVESVSGTSYGPLDVERIKAMYSGHEEVDPVYGVGWAQ